MPPLNKELYEAVLVRDVYRCRRCKDPKRLNVHHIIYRCHGGQDTLENLMLLCFPCHKDWHSKDTRKQPRPLRELQPWLEEKGMVEALREFNLLKSSEDFTIVKNDDIIPFVRKKYKRKRRRK